MVVKVRKVVNFYSYELLLYNHLHVSDRMDNPLNKHLEAVDRCSIDGHIPYGVINENCR
jgi:hypothetical protein